MKHYSQAEWADYSRGVVLEHDRASMQKHLDDGCKECATTVRMWAALAEVAKQEPGFTPPAGALRVAESYFYPLKSALREGRDLKLARCTFDSLGQQPIGIRGFDTGKRQLMYQCGELFIDMNWGSTTDRRGLILAGQVVDARSPAGGVVGVPVALVSGADTLSNTTTSQFGEFHFSLKAEGKRELKLLFEVEDAALMVLLPDTDTAVPQS